MADPRRDIMHAAVAAGGASAVLMSLSAHCQNESEIRAAASECIEPLLRAAMLAIDSAGALPGEEQRAALRDVIADYIDLPAIGQPGRCRICGCVEQMACAGSNDGEWFGPCAWADDDRTLCDNPDCIAAAAAAQQERPSA